MPDVTMPRLSDSMEEATIVTWLVADGDQVTGGQELAEVETDKATVTFEAEAVGVIQLLVGVGETVPLGAVIARIDDGTVQPRVAAGSSIAAAANGSSASEPPTPVATTRAVRVADGAASGRPSASPLARRIAASLNVDLHAIEGSGPGGRIVRADVERAATEGPIDGQSRPAAPPAVVEAPRSDVAPRERKVDTWDGSGARGAASSVELSRTQRLIARRMAESRATIPDLDLSIEVDMEAACALREELKREADRDTPSINDMIVMASARALAEHPNANAAYIDGRLERFERVNVGIAVAMPDALVVPTIADADRRSLGDIARTARQLVARVRDGSITPGELSGATFTVSNLGMHGIDFFTAVINPPQAAILAVGAVKPRAVVHSGELVARRSMIATLAADHRVLYGADAAEFLSTLRQLVEQPLRLIAG
jgi:pyruvate dehydrogenase E2 component (dihydrolipoamide acetyltransferase)